MDMGGFFLRGLSLNRAAGAKRHLSLAPQGLGGGEQHSLLKRAKNAA